MLHLPLQRLLHKQVPITLFISIFHFSAVHRFFLSAISSIDEPKSFSHAIKSPQLHDVWLPKLVLLKDMDPHTSSTHQKTIGCK